MSLVVSAVMFNAMGNPHATRGVPARSCKWTTTRARTWCKKNLGTNQPYGSAKTTGDGWIIVHILPPKKKGDEFKEGKTCFCPEKCIYLMQREADWEKKVAAPLPPLPRTGRPRKRKSQDVGLLIMDDIFP